MGSKPVTATDIFKDMEEQHHNQTCGNIGVELVI